MMKMTNRTPMRQIKAIHHGSRANVCAAFGGLVAEITV